MLHSLYSFEMLIIFLINEKVMMQEVFAVKDARLEKLTQNYVIIKYTFLIFRKLKIIFIHLYLDKDTRCFGRERLPNGRTRIKGDSAGGTGTESGSTRRNNPLSEGKRCKLCY